MKGLGVRRPAARRAAQGDWAGRIQFRADRAEQPAVPGRLRRRGQAEPAPARGQAAGPHVGQPAEREFRRDAVPVAGQRWAADRPGSWSARRPGRAGRSRTAARSPPARTAPRAARAAPPPAARIVRADAARTSAPRGMPPTAGPRSRSAQAAMTVAASRSGSRPPRPNSLDRSSSGSSGGPWDSTAVAAGPPAGEAAPRPMDPARPTTAAPSRWPADRPGPGWPGSARAGRPRARPTDPARRGRDSSGRPARSGSARLPGPRCDPGHATARRPSAAGAAGRRSPAGSRPRAGRPPGPGHVAAAQDSGIRMTARSVSVVGMMSSRVAAGSSAGQNSTWPPARSGAECQPPGWPR